MIVVNDGSTDDTLPRARARRSTSFPSTRPRGTCSRPSRSSGYYRSPSDPRLIVVDKRNGGKADALNAALNHSRYRYVCGVDADMVFTRDALSRAMREIARDPDGDRRADELLRERRAIRRTSLVGRRRLLGARHAAALRVPDVRLPACVLQQPHAVGADELHALRGRRVPGLATRPRRGARRVVGATSRARTSSSRSGCTGCCASAAAGTGSRASRTASASRRGPTRSATSSSQRERWQRVILETCWANRRMCFNPRYGTVGLLGVPFYLVSEIVAPVFELLAIGTLRRGRCRRPDRLVGVRPRLTLADHVRQQRAHDRCAADARPRGAGLSSVRRSPDSWR